jgi:nucleotidyltransferase substrate binding protein (TIGR01987 family)
MEKLDIRWKQRFSNYCKAVAQMNKFVEKDTLNEFEIQGLIQCFEYTYELAWNVMKDFLVSKGYTNIVGSRDSISLAFENDLLDDGLVWMEMVKDRNKSTHTYNESTAIELEQKILHSYSFQFQSFKEKMEKFV